MPKKLPTALFISQCFPPMLNVGGKRAYRFARHLHLYGWRPVVWTGEAPKSGMIDETPFDLRALHIERTFEPTHWFRPHLSYINEKKPLGNSKSSFGYFKKIFAVPFGKDVLLLPRAAILLTRLCWREDVKLIFASSGPYIVTLQAWLVSRLTGLPFILDLRDPWSLNFLQQHKPAWIRAVESRIERFVFKRAARLILTCENATEAYRRLYPELPAEKILTITNSFEIEFRAERAPSEGPVRLIHFGNCLNERSLKPLLLALARLKEQKKLPPEGIELINYGRVLAKDLELAAALDLSNVLRCAEPLGYEKGIAALANSNLQILLNYDDGKLYIPGKTFDYLLAGVPILCLSQRCELTEIIEKNDAGYVAEPADIDAIAEIILNAGLARSDSVKKPTLRTLGAYEAKNTTRKLVSEFNAVTSEE